MPAMRHRASAVRKRSKASARLAPRVGVRGLDQTGQQPWQRAVDRVRLLHEGEPVVQIQALEEPLGERLEAIAAGDARAYLDQAARIHDLH